MKFFNPLLLFSLFCLRCYNSEPINEDETSLLLLDDDEFTIKPQPLPQDIIRGINWFGLETEYYGLMCTWQNPIDWHLEKIDHLGFNYIRLPFSVEYVQRGEWSQMDSFFHHVQNHESIKVVLDCHRLHSTHQSSKPYDNFYSFDVFLDSWRIILDRYQNVNNLESVDIFNEYQSENYVEWNSIARQTLTYIEYHFPERFHYMVGGTNWGGNLHYVSVEDLPFSKRVSYSIHKYWFSDTEQDYEEKWNYSFADVNLPLINVGEWGYKSTSLKETEWAESFVDFLIKKNLRDTFFWTYSYNSGDTAGVLLEDCTTVDEKKMELLHYLWNN